MTTDRRRLLQRLAFSESRHFSWDMLPANTMSYDNLSANGCEEDVFIDKNNNLLPIQHSVGA